MQTPSTVLQLVERFDTHRDHYTSTNYNEAQVRREFIDPLFQALGWDVQNTKGYAQPFKEVIHEDAIRVAGVTKAPEDHFPQVTIRDVFALPLGTVRPSLPHEVCRDGKMLSLVQRMLDLHKRAQAAETEHERGVFQRQIAATDQKIDRLVYDFYGLGKEEIAIVEESVKK